jgi:hypothetical protein
LTGCTWTATSPEPWAQLQTRSGNGETQVDVAVGSNPGSSPRSVNVVIAGQNFTITQSGTEPAAPAPSPSPSPSPGPAPAPGPSPGPAPSPSPQLCVTLIDPVTRFVKGKGGDETVKVETGSTCTWKAVSSVSWVTVRGSGEGTGSRELKYDVERNSSSSTRIGTISIAGVPHFIVQEPADGDDD